MCGLHCIVDFSARVGLNSIEAMLKSTLHRGREAHFYRHIVCKQLQVFLGHNLLQISSNSLLVAQPFSKNEKCWLIFNGEIYNWQELDREFAFENQTQSDTETLWNYLQKVVENITYWGKLQGIFAFIFYDKEKNILLTARDRWGVKPLYYYQDTDKYLFASEVQSFWASELVQPYIRRQAITEYLLYRFAIPPKTFFEKVYHHPTALQIHDLSEKSVRTFPYLQKPFFLHKSPPSLLVKEAENLLQKAIHKQYLQGAYKPALLLSGGVDSTLLWVLARKLGYRLKAFGLVTQENNFTQDVSYIQKARKLFEVDVEEVCINEEYALQLPSLIRQMDYPVADSAFLATFLLSQRANKLGFRVLWSGAGADELFGGYHRDWAFQWYLKSPLFWLGVKNLITLCLPKTRLYRKFWDNLKTNYSDTFLNFASLDIIEPKLHSFSNITTLQAAFEWERKYYLQADLLKINDFWGMRNTIEIRVPFLDEVFSDFALQIPANTLLKFGKKWILKAILRKYGGGIFTKRKKEGLGIPFGNWLKKPQNAFLWKRLLQQDNPIFEFVSQKRVQYLLQAHQCNRADYTSELFALYVLSEWLFAFG